MTDRMVSTSTAALILGVGTDKVRRLADQGRLPVTMRDGIRTYKAKDVDALKREMDREKNPGRNKKE